MPAVSADGRAWWNGKQWVRPRQRTQIWLLLLGLFSLMVLPVYALLTWAVIAGAPGTDSQTSAQIARDERVREFAGRLFVVLGPTLFVGGVVLFCAALWVRNLPLRPIRPDEAPPQQPQMASQQ